MQKKLGALILVAVLAAAGGAFLMTQTQEAQREKQEKAATDKFRQDMKAIQESGQ